MDVVEVVVLERSGLQINGAQPLLPEELDTTLPVAVLVTAHTILHGLQQPYVVSLSSQTGPVVPLPVLADRRAPA